MSVDVCLFSDTWGMKNESLGCVIFQWDVLPAGEDDFQFPTPDGTL